MQIAEHNLVIKNIVESALKRRASLMGYERSKNQKYNKRRPYKKDFFSYFEAFFGEVEVFHDGNVGIWLDPTIKWKFKMKLFLDWAKKNNLDEVNKYLLNKKVKFPSVTTNKYYTGKVKAVDNIAIKDYTFENEDHEIISLFNYWTKRSPSHTRWLKRHQIQLCSEEKPVILVEMPKIHRSLPYPPSTLEIVIDLLDPIIPDYAFQEKKTLTPEKRIKETIVLYNTLLRDGFDLGTAKLNFEKKLFNWKNNSLGYGNVVSLQAPILQFGKGGTCAALKPWLDPNIKNAMFQYGPVNTKVITKVSYVGPESELKNFPRFNEYLNSHAQKLNLGTFHFNNSYLVDRLDSDRYMRVCQSIGRVNNEEIIIVILPRINPTKTYYATKRGLGNNSIKSEMLQWKTYRNLLKSSLEGKLSFANYNIALKAYGRNLNCGEAIWHLKQPAGGLNPNQNNLFMGFDVSRNIETKKEAAAYAAVCDNYGKILYRNSINTHRGEKVIAEVLSDWMFELAFSTYDEIGIEKKIDNLFLFKDGPIPNAQIDEYRRGTLLAKERLLKEHIMDKSSDIKTIAVIKRGLHRFYGDEKYSYRVNHSCLIRNPKEAIIITSKPRIGTASTTRLNLIHQINDDMNIEQIVKIFNDLRYLDWSSLFQQPKTILPLHIVQNLAKLSKEDIVVPYDPR
ncbi:hypothetical protein ES708_07325 [subsurface metagenome]